MFGNTEKSDSKILTILKYIPTVENVNMVEKLQPCKEGGVPLSTAFNSSSHTLYIHQLSSFYLVSSLLCVHGADQYFTLLILFPVLT